VTVRNSDYKKLKILKKRYRSMARKRGEDYFDTFVRLVDHSCKAANLLYNIMNDFNAEELRDKMSEMHEIEHGGDTERHAMIRRLSREFITPIDREDIMALADAIDDVTDTIEDVLLRLYMFNIRSIKEHAKQMAEIIVKCCNALKKAVSEFRDFQKSKVLHDLIVEVNVLEEEGDRIYTDAVHHLYVNSKNVVEIMAWDQTYDYLENCCDACEEVANVIEYIMLKNS
jgi:predicted phosphate transport protein (TIGR00153 family)